MIHFRHARHRWGFAASLLFACGPGNVAGDPLSGSTAGETGSTSDSDSTSGSSSASTVSGSESDPSTGDESGAIDDTCGNRAVDPGEECDDGNQVDGDACSSRCTLAFDVVWTVSHDDGAGGSEHAHAVVVDTEWIYVLGDEDPLGAPVRRLWLQQYAHDGAPGWTLTYTGPTELGASGRGLSVMPGGDLVVVGSVRASGTDDDVLVMRVDPIAQSIEWSNTFDASAASFDDRADAVVVDRDGNLVVTGRKDSFGVGGISEVWVAGFSADGAPQWSQTWSPGRGLAAFGDALAVRDDARVEVIATLPASFSPPSSQLVVVDPGGAAPEAVGFRGAVIHDFDPVADGRRLAVGTIDASTIAGWRFDASWSEEWAITGPPGVAYAVAHDRRDRVAIAGAIESGTSLLRWVAELDAEGTPIWADPEPASGLPSVWNDVAIDAQGDVITVGSETTSDAQSNAVVRKYHPR